MTVDALSASDLPLNTDGDRRRVVDGLDVWLAVCTSVNINSKKIINETLLYSILGAARSGWICQKWPYLRPAYAEAEIWYTSSFTTLVRDVHAMIANNTSVWRCKSCIFLAQPIAITKLQISASSSIFVTWRLYVNVAVKRSSSPSTSSKKQCQSTDQSQSNSSTDNCNVNWAELWHAVVYLCWKLSQEITKPSSHSASNCHS